MMKQKRITNIVLLSNEKQIPSLLRQDWDIKKTEVITCDKNLNTVIESKRKDIHPQFYGDLVSDTKSWKWYLEEEKRLFESLKNTESSRKNLTFDFEGEEVSLLDLDIASYLSGHVDFYANFLYKVDVLNSILKKFQPEKIFILSPETDWERVMEMLSEGKRGRVRIIHLNRLRNKFNSFISRNCYTTGITIFNSGRININIKIPYIILPGVVKLRNYIEGIKNGLKPKKREEIDILFLVSGPRKKYINFVLPVIEEIDSEKLYKTLLLIPNNYTFDDKELLKKEKIRFETLESYINYEIIRAANSKYSEILRNFKKGGKKVLLRDLCYYDGHNFDFLLEQYSKTVYGSGSDISNFFLVNRIINIHKPRIFITPFYLEPALRAFKIICKRADMPIVCIRRGTTLSHPEHGEFIADIHLVSGEKSKSLVQEFGVPEEKIKVTGIPIFDELLSKKEDMEKIKDEIRDKLNISEKNIVTYLTQTIGGDFDISKKMEEIEKVLTAIKKLDNSFLIIKMHPTENFDKQTYKNICERLGYNRYKITRDEYDLGDILISSDVVVTKHSSAGFNALISECDLICVDFCEAAFSKDNFFVESGVAGVAKNEEELYKLLIKSLESSDGLVSQKKINEFLQYHYFKSDGKSSQRIKNEIYSMIEKKEIQNEQIH